MFFVLVPARNWDSKTSDTDSLRYSTEINAFEASVLSVSPEDIRNVRLVKS